jgi:hypothetical protein
MIELPTITDLSMEEDEHHYRVPGGMILPSVTHIQRFLHREIYGGTPGYAMQDAAERGKRVHELTRQMDAYGFAMSPPEDKPYLDGYQKFKDERRPVWIAREWMAYHKTLRYAGTLDAAGYVEPDNGTGVDVLDIKTTQQYYEVLVASQVSAYSEILKSWGIPVRDRYCLMLRPDGTYLLVKLPNKFSTFMFCMGLHNEF